MDDLGFNKIAGAVLATGLGMLLLMNLPSVVMGHSGEEIAYKVGTIEVPGGEKVEEIILPFPQENWVAAMDETSHRLSQALKAIGHMKRWTLS